MASQIVRFEPNQPERMALRFSDGKPVNGKYGPQVFYTLDDGRSMYAPPALADVIDTLKIKRGQPFIVTARPRGVWDVEVETGAIEQRQADPAKTPPVAGTNNNVTNHPASKGESAEQIQSSSPARLLMASLCASIDAALEAEAYALRKGLAGLRFETEDIRAMAATVFIQVCRQAEQQGGRF